MKSAPSEGTRFSWFENKSTPRSLGECCRSGQGRSFSRTFLGRVEIQASHFFVLYSFEGESNSLKHLKIVLEIIQTARGVMPAAHLEATEAPSFPANELSSNWKKTQPSHYLISLKTKTDPVRCFFVFFNWTGSLVLRKNTYSGVVHRCGWKYSDVFNADSQSTVFVALCASWPQYVFGWSGNKQTCKRMWWYFYQIEAWVKTCHWAHSWDKHPLTLNVGCWLLGLMCCWWLGSQGEPLAFLWTIHENQGPGPEIRHRLDWINPFL